ncbi:hypothetical protein HOT99_gp240 [Caulobacter phage CcrBL10]|uniref:Transmembrane protein n=1 Tax=Caulobacter phage CcrBL10 TaxID=2283269 RepID=A0A385EC43_9CAUD|nr:hypothetical protein HOT99_gp240 [Caulobacter phage CcrBL10]AXQ68377.1 hypothetical protein CcrBL10_gp173c [Caulobacter phage CcrBL10]
MRLFLPLFPLYLILMVAFLVSALGGPSAALRDKRLPGLFYRLSLYPTLVIIAGVLVYMGFAWTLTEAHFVGSTIVAFLVLVLGMPTVLLFAMKLLGDIAKAFHKSPKQPKEQSVEN